jgi:integrase
MSKRFTNTTSDFIEWSDMLNLVRNLFEDKNYKMSLLVSCGSFFGLRISDLLSLSWEQILNTEYLELTENKTGKKRIVKINPKLQKHIKNCYAAISPISINSKCFVSQMGTVYSIQRINVILKEIKSKYNLKVDNFSTHSLRKTFGREVYTQAGTNSEFALIKLSELFNHSNTSVTRRYLGLKFEEMMQTYDCLTF